MKLEFGKLVLAWVVLVCVVPVSAEPILKVDPEVFDWGRQAENKELYEFKFSLVNEGDTPLKIQRIRPGCGCTKVDVPKMELAPGETMPMTGTLKTKGYEGRMSKGIIITSNDVKRSTRIARLEIRFPYSAEGLRTRYTKFWAHLRSEKLYVYITVENCEPDKAYSVSAAELPPGWSCQKALPLEVAPENRAVVVLVRSVEGDPEPFEKLPFSLITDCPKTPEIEGTISYRKRPKVPKIKGDTQAKQDGAKAAPAAATGGTTVKPVAPKGETKGAPAVKGADEAVGK